MFKSEDGTIHEPEVTCTKKEAIKCLVHRYRTKDGEIAIKGFARELYLADTDTAKVLRNELSYWLKHYG